MDKLASFTIRARDQTISVEKYEAQNGIVYRCIFENGSDMFIAKAATSKYSSRWFEVPNLFKNQELVDLIGSAISRFEDPLQTTLF